MAFKPTFAFMAYRITAVEITEQPDGFALIRIAATPVRTPCERTTIDFLVGHSCNKARSKRFEALLHATGVTEKVEDTHELTGRYFAMKEGGKTPHDFATLEYASACLRSDRDAYERAKIYAAEEAERELGLVA